MRLLTLNVWGGRIHEGLVRFVAAHAGSVDIFCFQEVFDTPSGVGFSNNARMSLLGDLVMILPDHDVRYAVKSTGYDYEGVVDFPVSFGNVLFIKKNFEVLAYEELFEIINHPYHNWKENAIAKAQMLQFAFGQNIYTLCNFHGIWINGTGKLDTAERINQSEYLKNTLDRYSGKKIIAGDFNLLPQTRSIKILEDGMRNLITDFGVVSTRSSFYNKEVGFADYILTSPDIMVKNFEVLPGEVSDHLALVLDFN